MVMLLVVEEVLEVVGLVPLLRLLEVAALVGVVDAVAFRLLAGVAALVGVAVVFVVDNCTLGTGFAAGLLSNVTPFKKNAICLAFGSSRGGRVLVEAGT